MNIKQVFKYLDDFIGYYSKAKNGSKPPVIRLNKEQHRLLKKWADERVAIPQDTVLLGKDGNVERYKDIEVRVQ